MSHRASRQPALRQQRQLFDQLKAAVISNYEAEERAGLTSTLNTERRERLPYYGELLVNSCSGGSYLESDKAEQRYGRIANPVVHVVLNQIRKVANSYLSLYGKPEQICIELARDMNKSAEEREKDEKDAAGNRAKNEAYAKRLAGDKRQLNRSDLTRLKLHDMQKGECLYTGQPISMENLFDGSVEVDHILPRVSRMTTASLIWRCVLKAQIRTRVSVRRTRPFPQVMRE